MLNKVILYIRLYDWYDSKIPFMMAGFLLFYYIEIPHYSLADFYIRFFLYFVYVFMFLAFSYVINDYSDMEIDKAAGKQKVICELPKGFVLFTMIAMICIGTIPLLILLNFNIGYIALTIILYFGGVAYSVHTFRFKEKGAWGLLECSIVQRCLPLLILCFLVKTSLLFLGLWILLSFVNGGRYLLIHQAVDLENDKKTGVKTYVSECYMNYRIWIKILLIIEIILVGILLGKVYINCHYIVVFVLIYIIFERILSIVVKKYMNTDWLCTFLAVPLEDLYNVFLPVLFSLLLILMDVKYIGIFLFIMILTLRCFLGKAAFLKVYIQSLFKH